MWKCTDRTLHNLMMYEACPLGRTDRHAGPCMHASFKVNYLAGNYSTQGSLSLSLAL